MSNDLGEQIKSIDQKIALATSNLANAVKQVKAGKVVPKIDDLHDELNRLNADRRQLEKIRSGGAPDADIPVPVDELASWLLLTPTRVQQLAKKGITIKTEHGVYQLKASVQGYIREMNAKADGKNSEYHKHRTRKIKIAADDAEREFKTAMGLLINAEKYRLAREKKDADIKQKLLAFEKILPQKLAGLPADAQVPIIRNEIRKILTELAATERPLGSDRAGGPDVPAVAGPVGEPVGGREAGPQQ